MTRGIWRAAVAAALAAMTSSAAAQIGQPGAQSEQPGVVEDAALRIGLDATPERMLVDLFPELMANYPEFAGAVQQVNPTNVQWTAAEVTVAFHGGSTEVHELIEAAAAEWTAHSRTFRFSFRDGQGKFRQWRPTETRATANIRIGFGPGGYWSRLGILATDRDFSPLTQPTMNLEGLDTALQEYVGDQKRQLWLASYLHHVVLHEFGHALGLAHEHFHPDCQRDLKLNDETGYQPRKDERGAFVSDAAGRKPGVLRAFQGFPNNWTETNARFNLSAADYFKATRETIARELNVRSTIESSPAIDRRSVLLYAFDPSLLISGAQSACIGTGDGRFTDGARFATRLSPGDIAYFRRYYDKPSP